MWKEVIALHEGCSWDGKDSVCALRLIDDNIFAWKNGNKVREGPGQENVGTERSLYPRTTLKAKKYDSILEEGKETA